MELLVEARQLSAVAPGGMLFTAMDATVRLGDVVVISGPTSSGRTALMLALSGRFALSGGSLHAADGQRLDPSHLRRRTSVARALSIAQTPQTLRVSEVIAERRAISGRKNVSVETVRHALAAMGLEAPPPSVLVQEMGPVERVVFDLALAHTPQADGIFFDGLDEGLPSADRDFVREAVSRLAALGPALVVTSTEPGWGTVDIALPWESQTANRPVQEEPSGREDDGAVSTPVADDDGPAQPADEEAQ